MTLTWRLITIKGCKRNKSAVLGVEHGNKVAGSRHTVHGQVYGYRCNASTGQRMAQRQHGGAVTGDTVNIDNYRITGWLINLAAAQHTRSEEHTSEPSHVKISYAVFCLK